VCEIGRVGDEEKERWEIRMMNLIYVWKYIGFYFAIF
jgi:hypothetical protein